MSSARIMLSGRPLRLGDNSDKIPVVLHSGLQDMKEKLLPLGAELRYVGKMGDIQQISIYVLWAILLREATFWELGIWIYDPQMTWTTHNSSGWTSLPDCDICCQFVFTELWGGIVGIWRLLPPVFLLPLYSPYSETNTGCMANQKYGYVHELRFISNAEWEPVVQQL